MFIYMKWVFATKIGSSFVFIYLKIILCFINYSHLILKLFMTMRCAPLQKKPCKVLMIVAIRNIVVNIIISFLLTRKPICL